MKSDITTRQLKSFKFEIDMDCICFKIDLRGKSGLFSVSIDRHPNQKITVSRILAKQFISTVKTMTIFCCLVILIQWRPAEMQISRNTVEIDQQIRFFVNRYDLKYLVREPTCFGADNPRCIDIILTNRYRSFQHTTTSETGHSEFHKLIVAVLKIASKKLGQVLLTIEVIRTFWNRLSNVNFRKSWAVSKQQI